VDFALLLLKLEDASGMNVVEGGEHVDPQSNAILVLVLKTLQNLQGTQLTRRPQFITSSTILPCFSRLRV
jgi:hypothetical protein